MVHFPPATPDAAQRNLGGWDIEPDQSEPSSQLWELTLTAVGVRLFSLGTVQPISGHRRLPEGD